MYEKTFFKQGATFGRVFTLANNGVPVTGVASNIASSVTDKSGTVIGTATVTESTSTPGTYILSIPAATTASWPVSGALWDIKYTDADGDVLKSRTKELIIEREVTP